MAMLVPLLSSTTICFIQFVCILVHNHSYPFSVPYVLKDAHGAAHGAAHGNGHGQHLESEVGAVHGEEGVSDWGPWEAWGPCNTTSLMQTRFRKCVNPGGCDHHVKTAHKQSFPCPKVTLISSSTND